MGDPRETCFCKEYRKRCSVCMAWADGWDDFLAVLEAHPQARVADILSEYGESS